MSSQNGAVRQPAGDLSAFDISKRSPEEIARLFARWKQQRKALQVTPQEVRAAAASAPKSRAPRFMPVTARRHTAPEAEAAAEPARPGPHSLRYSAPFAAVLEAGPDVADAEPFGKLKFNATGGSSAERLGRLTFNPGEPLPLHGARRRSKSRWVLAGAASIIAVVAASGAALWHQAPSLRPGLMHAQSALPVAVAPSAPAQRDVEAAAPAADPTAARMAARLLPAATRLPKTVPSPWPMAADVALMQPASPANEITQLRLAPRLKPEPVAVRTASQGTQDPPPIAASGVEIKAEKVTPAAGVHNPSAVSVAIPAAGALQPRTDEEPDPGTQPESLHRRGNDKELVGRRGDDHGPTGARGAHASG
ncbi:MAG TPA: hypothetical protein VLB05_00410, partial [Dongiaceae bacterium]|nr:hypothetical protein [Dongiaceae bacterium]